MSKFFSQKYSNLVPYTPGEQPTEAGYIKLNTNESPFKPSRLSLKYAEEAAKQLQLYPDPEYRTLVDIASKYFSVDNDEIIFANGSDEVLNFAFAAFCDINCPAAFPDITYAFYSVFAKINRVPYEQIRLNADFTINVNDYIGLNKTIFIANPNAPTGISLPLGEIEKIVSGNPNNVVVVDEAYVDFGAESAVSLIHKYNNLLVTQTFSKSRAMAGARLGFGIGNKELIRDLNTVKYSTNPYNVNSVTMAAGIGALEDNDYFVNNCKKIISTRSWTVSKLRDLGFEVNESKTNFVFAKHRKISGKELYTLLKKKGILVRHFDDEMITDYNRITIGSDEQMKILINTLKEILEAKNENV